MHKRLIIISFNIVFLIFLLSLSYTEDKPSFEPMKQEVKNSALKTNQENFVLFGTSAGIYYWETNNEPVLIWNQGEVKKILKVESGYYFLTSKGVVFSDNLKDFKELNQGLSFKVIKHFKDGKKSFTNDIQDLKDLEVDPANPKNLVTCTKDKIFYSQNGGETWNGFDNPTRASGIKAVAVFSNPDLQIFFTHPFQGIFYKNISKKGKWEQWNEGMYKYSKIYEEVSDILIKKEKDQYRIFAANNFIPIVYELNLKNRVWKKLFKMKENFGMIENLSFSDGLISFITEKGFMEYDSKDSSLQKVNIEKLTSAFEEKIKTVIESMYLVENGKEVYNLSELWLVTKNNEKKYLSVADRKEGIYLQTHLANDKKRLTETRNLMEKVGLNMVTIDMKDDFGHLRFKTDNPILKKMDSVKNPIDIERFTAFMKEKKIYLVARMVIFKDEVAYRFDNGRYAVKDKSSGKSWRGIINGKYNKEYWVDPYSEEIWEYNVEAAKELIKKGFDEIQFDYIRFPTDGDNLGQTHYSFKDKGMDKESALISFLSYARENIDAPISIDIYGANGWHRTGARTGQEVEMLQKFVDVICPMYYPSHFAQEFLAHPPVEERTYRIYYFGSLRNYYMAKKNTVVRGWVQAFKMNKSFDNKYYSEKYISNQVKGVRESIDMGYTFWNSGSKYSILLNAYSEKNKPEEKKTDASTKAE